MTKKLALIILDGLAIGSEYEGNAFKLANTPMIDNLFEKYPGTTLNASGRAVGLQEGQMGDSNVGHLNIGAGRIVWQMLPKIKKAVEEGLLEESESLKKAIEESINNKRPLHLMGLVSDGGVHSHMDIIKDLLEHMSKYDGLQVAIHAILDGRDVPPRSAKKYIKKLQAWCKKYPFASIKTVSGRYYTMDRDNRWDRTELAYKAMSDGIGLNFDDPLEAIEYSYQKGINDEFVKPSIINSNEGMLLQEGDNLFFFNFRTDRARQITTKLIDNGIKVTGMTEYDEDFHIPIIIHQDDVKNTLAEWLSKKGLKQLHIAETEKYAHVTFFFNGGREEPFRNEERILVNSPNVATYDLKPEMSAYEVTKKTIETISEIDYDFIILNYANCDMVGHTGDISAAIKAVEAVDDNLSKLIPALISKGYQILITADHGNVEQMIVNDKPHTAHTLNKVPFIMISDENFELKGKGKLGDIAPTVLDLLKIDKPKEMTGESLLIKEN
ncbi:MAG: 2,3-bisphosphoglycerate-independent phosphoglycerate mutase [Clostridia bacterium]